MNTSRELLSRTLADGRIGDDEVLSIRSYIDEQGPLDLDDVKLLVELYVHAEFGPSFADLFFEVLEKVFLADGTIDQAEQFYLLKMLYSDRIIRDRERAFLWRLRHEAAIRSAEFDALCETALASPNSEWDVGGRPS